MRTVHYNVDGLRSGGQTAALTRMASADLHCLGQKSAVVRELLRQSTVSCGLFAASKCDQSSSDRSYATLVPRSPQSSARFLLDILDHGEAACAKIRLSTARQLRHGSATGTRCTIRFPLKGDRPRLVVHSSPPLTRRGADHPRKHPCEMALIRKSADQGDLGQGLLRVAEQFTRLLDTA